MHVVCVTGGVMRPESVFHTLVSPQHSPTRVRSRMIAACCQAVGGGVTQQRAILNDTEENDGDGRWIPDAELLASRCDTRRHTTVHTAAAGASPSVVQHVLSISVVRVVLYRSNK